MGVNTIKNSIQYLYESNTKPPYQEDKNNINQNTKSFQIPPIVTYIYFKVLIIFEIDIPIKKHYIDF